MQSNFKISILVLLITASASFAGLAQVPTNKQKIENTLYNYFNSNAYRKTSGHYIKDTIRINKIEVSKKKRTINIYFNIAITTSPIRYYLIDSLKNEVKKSINGDLASYQIDFFADERNLKEYTPNYYRTSKKDFDFERSYKKFDRKWVPLVQNISHPTKLKSQLNGINIALWNSHGWYYEPTLHRWEWQRARLFNTVEDLYPTAYVLHYLMPMLENAGANVFIPRDRYWQNHEVIVDNDSSTNKSQFITHENFNTLNHGYKHSELISDNTNPFSSGSSVEFTNLKKNTVYAEWIPFIPESGDYPVYISYSENNKDRGIAKYLIYHSGGVSEYLVNQNLSAGTWIYLGNFKFNKGVNSNIVKIVLESTKIQKKQTLTADAIRLGNGMGIISRNGLTSQRLKYQEAARYYLQYAGFPDSIVWNQNENDDYADDRHARTAWVNYLIGAPSGPKKNRNAKGLGIPIDLTLAFHTDAGITNSDSVLGTLGIYYTKLDSEKFPNGKSRMSSRDLTDLVQSQIVSDLRTKYDSNWVRRDMWDKAYTEAARPNTPTMILELLSHQNFMDVRFGKEPEFQFDVCRATYKGILKFLKAYYGIPYIVQPLPVTHFSSQFNNNEIVLNWKEQTDSLEPTAKPESYIVYTKINDNGYDNGTPVEGTSYSLKNFSESTIYSFKVTAVNKGGESFPSEELSVAIAPDSKGEVLVVNAFDRLGGAAWFNDTQTAGFLTQQDAGVPYMYDIHTTGDQYDFMKDSPWIDDDAPGFGASYADMEDKIMPGNTFNFAYIHGKSILKAGYSFVSVSDEAFEYEEFQTTKYKLLDFIAGEEKTSYLPKNTIPKYSIFTTTMLSKLKHFTNNGGNLFISGAHIASDAKLTNTEKEVEELLHYKYRTSNASKKGNVYAPTNLNFDINDEFVFNTGYHKSIYTVEGADALEPADNNSKTILRYKENNMSAATFYEGSYKVVAAGFPFETIINENDRDSFMSRILKILSKNE